MLHHIKTYYIKWNYIVSIQHILNQNKISKQYKFILNYIESYTILNNVKSKHIAIS